MRKDLKIELGEYQLSHYEHQMRIPEMRQMLADFYRFVPENERLDLFLDLERFHRDGLPPTLQRYIEIVAMARPAEVQSQKVLMHNMFFLHHSGSRHFYIDEKLGRALLSTDIQATSTKFVKLPFNCIYVQIPRTTGVFVHNLENEAHPLVGFYLYKFHAHNMDRLGVTAVGQKDPTDVEHSAIFSFTVPLAGETIEECIGLYFEGHHERFKQRYTPEFVAKVTSQIDSYLRFVFNCILYINSMNADVILAKSGRSQIESRLKGLKSAGKAKKLERKLERIAPNDRFHFGKYIVIDPAYHSESEHSRYAGRKLTERQEVRGHWWPRSPTALHPEQRWVSPYFRGPEAAEVIHKNFKVK